MKRLLSSLLFLVRKTAFVPPKKQAGQAIVKLPDLFQRSLKRLALRLCKDPIRRLTCQVRTQPARVVLLEPLTVSRTD